MRKVILLGILCAMFSGVAFAEDYTFEPVEIPITNPQNTALPQAPKEPVTNAQTTAPSTTSEAQEGGFQNALLNLDSAQVDMRDKLLEYKAQYTEIDAQYNKYKTQRAEMKKTIKTMERKIKNIDKYKNSIRKDMM